MASGARALDRVACKPPDKGSAESRSPRQSASCAWMTAPSDAPAGRSTAAGPPAACATQVAPAPSRHAQSRPPIALGRVTPRIWPDVDRTQPRISLTRFATDREAHADRPAKRPDRRHAARCCPSAASLSQSHIARPAVRIPQSSRWTRSIRSWRSCASIDSVAIGRASSRLRPIGSPVSSQKP
jgi:hypothetical protein